MPVLTLTAAFLTLAIGAAVFWANPQRATNWVFAGFSLVSTFYLTFVYMAMRAGEQQHASPLAWIRMASAAGAFFPTIIWLMKESIVSPAFRSLRTLRSGVVWSAASVVLVSLVYTNSFINAEPNVLTRSRGVPYTLYTSISSGLYLLIVWQTYRQWRSQTGIRKLEIQVLILNAGIGCLLASLLFALGNYLDLRSVSRLTPLIIVIFYASTAWAVTIHRVFDARQVFLSVTQRSGVIVTLSVGILAGWRILGGIIPSTAALVISIAVFSTFAFWLERQTRDWFSLSASKNTAVTRKAALEIARREADPTKLVTEFEALLRAWCQTNSASLLFDSSEAFVAGEIEIAKDRPGFTALCRQGWTTPESLQRRRAEPGLVDLRQIVGEHSLGLIVTAPHGSPAPSLILTLGIKINHRPFTYPEVQQVQQIAEFMDNILARSKLSMQARQSEQLATIGLIGASLAHEIRNPLVSIKTFSSLLSSRYEDPEFRRRFSVLIPTEVERIDSLTQQLLDLSNPRRHQMDRVSLHTVVQETSDLMLTRAHDAGVTVAMQLSAGQDTIWADPSAIRQVLINLLINAFQALETQEGERRVQIRTRNSPNGSVILEVIDNGPGIPPEHRNRLFHPFASTKTKGMGLGLAVCADILHEHRATVIVPDVGRPGATFRITFPCPPPSS